MGRFSQLKKALRRRWTPQSPDLPRPGGRAFECVVGGLLQFWVRLPAEFVLGVLPYTAAGALFSGWLVAGKPRRGECAE